MNEVIALARDLGGVGFPTLLVLIIFGSFKEYWVWGRQLIELRADYERRLSSAVSEKIKWESIAMKALGLAENGVVITKQRMDGSA